jgi:hypothetical protein
MSATVAGATELVHDLQLVFADRLLSVVAYGGTRLDNTASGLTTFVLVSSLTQEDLDACARSAARWSRGGVDTPLILPEPEFHRSLDVFPLEYADMLASHVRLFGRDPFDGAVIQAEDLRRACEQQVKSHLLHLREAHGDPLAVARMVSASAPAFAALLRSTARLLGAAPVAGIDAAVTGAGAIGLDEGVVRDVLSLEQRSNRHADGARLFPGYLTAVERLAHAIDTWR